MAGLSAGLGQDWGEDGRIERRTGWAGGAPGERAGGLHLRLVAEG